MGFFLWVSRQCYGENESKLKSKREEEDLKNKREEKEPSLNEACGLNLTIEFEENKHKREEIRGKPL